MSKYTADFETITDVNDCRVWAWAMCEIGNPDFFEYGLTIQSFMDYLRRHDKITLYFHNLKFDGEFIISHLFNTGFTFTPDRKDMRDNQFTTLISDTGQFYSLEIKFRGSSIKIFDSLKILPYSVADIAKGFGLPITKLEIDYKQHRAINQELTHDELAYIRNDCDIVARALHIMFRAGINENDARFKCLARLQANHNN